MSRIGKKPILIPDNVKISVSGRSVQVEGPKGKLSYTAPEAIAIRVENKTMLLDRSGDSSREKALHGLSRSLIANMVQGTRDGFTKKLEIQGVGFKASVQGDKLNLNLGFSHPIHYPIPTDIKITVTDAAGKKVNEGTFLTIEGVDKQLVGAVAADIRRYYPPEPYKGKGVRYVGEHIIRKEGKTAQSK
ncbi:MAG: 50S ribosomal protein L6 [Verrucomicrobiae bacterium]|nr:50S ribosomal protein L6 [Verrucomicrobiae bacterium]